MLFSIQLQLIISLNEKMGENYIRESIEQLRKSKLISVKQKTKSEVIKCQKTLTHHPLRTCASGPPWACRGAGG